MPGLLESFAALRDLLGRDFVPWAVAWARALPVVIVVPAFGLGGIAPPIRVVLSLGLAACVAPALHGVAPATAPLWFVLLREAALGVPVALATAASLWVAVMTGGVLDSLRGARDSADLPVLGEPASPFGVLFGLLVAVGFLEAGGAERLARALGEPRLHTTFAVAAERLADSIGISVAVAAPLVVGSVLIELGSAFVARAASPAYVAPLLAPLRALGVLFVASLALDRVVELLVLLASRA